MIIINEDYTILIIRKVYFTRHLLHVNYYKMVTNSRRDASSSRLLYSVITLQRGSPMVVTPSVLPVPFTVVD